MTEQFALNWSNLATTKPAPDETQQLVNRCLAGDDTAYVALYNQCSGMIYRLAYGLLQNKEDAEEVLQDSFEYAFRRLDHFDPRKSAFTTWLYRIAVSRCRNKRRRKWLPTFSFNQINNEELTDTDSPSLDETLALNDRQLAVWQALKTLSPKLRETAVLRYYHGLRYQEIGDILSIPAKTAESRMRLVHKAMRKILQEQDIF
ncbi:MAG: RNA polymerase sigma factor [Chloroflexota bacterium]